MRDTDKAADDKAFAEIAAGVLRLGKDVEQILASFRLIVTARLLEFTAEMDEWYHEGREREE